MRRFSLTARQRVALERQLRTASNARLYRRALAVLQVAQGRPVTQVASVLRIGRRSLYRWLARYRQQPGPTALTDYPGRGRRPLYSAQQRALVDGCLRRPPAAFGYLARGWTLGLLQEHLRDAGLPPCSQDTLGRYLHALDWSWKRPRYVLEPDPEQEKKTPNQSPAQARRTVHRRAL